MNRSGQGGGIVLGKCMDIQMENDGKEWKYHEILLVETFCLFFFRVLSKTRK